MNPRVMTSIAARPANHSTGCGVPLRSATPAFPVAGGAGVAVGATNRGTMTGTTPGGRTTGTSTFTTPGGTTTGGNTTCSTPGGMTTGGTTIACGGAAGTTPGA